MIIIKNLKILFFRITLERFPSVYRPSSKPYISGDSFRKFADFIFDETTSFNTQRVRYKDIIFLNPDLIDIYFQTHHKKIDKKYYLITHNSDIKITEYINKYLDEKIIHWFALNLDSNIPNTTLIPMGLENLRRLRYGRKIWFNSKHNKKSKMILCSYNSFKNFDARKDIKNNLSDSKIIDFVNFTNTKEYFINLKKYQFIICPEGKSLDTSRIWEGLLLNVFPIFKKNSFTLRLQEIGIPGIYLEEWNDLDRFDDQGLIQEYAKLQKANFPKLYEHNYWEKVFKKLN